MSNGLRVGVMCVLFIPVGVSVGVVLEQCTSFSTTKNQNINKVRSGRILYLSKSFLLNYLLKINFFSVRLIEERNLTLC